MGTFRYLDPSIVQYLDVEVEGNDEDGLYVMRVELKGIDVTAWFQGEIDRDDDIIKAYEEYCEAELAEAEIDSWRLREAA